MKRAARFLLLGTVLLLGACGKDECRAYSQFTCRQLERADFNVHFYYPGTGSEHLLGTAKGLSTCRKVAKDYAEQRRVQTMPWGYACCMRAKGSACYEKHK